MSNTHCLDWINILLSLSLLGEEPQQQVELHVRFDATKIAILFNVSISDLLTKHCVEIGRNLVHNSLLEHKITDSHESLRHECIDDYFAC